MRIAVIGLGVISKVHIAVIKSLGERIVAVCDNDEKRLEQYPEIAGYTDYERMFDEQEIDVVHICLPHFLHTQVILSALKRNINVLCEKPLCIKNEDIQAIISAQKCSSAQLGVCFQNRYNASVREVQRLLSNKKILSASARLTWHRDKNYYAQGEWRGKKALEGGGVLINQAIHTIDLMQLLLGMPKSVICKCDKLSLKGVIKVEDTARKTCNGENSFTLIATNAALSDYPVEICIQTQGEQIRLVGNKVYVNGKCKICKEEGILYGKAVYGTGHGALISDFYNCVKMGEKFKIDAQAASNAVKIVLAAYQSNGEEIPL